MKDYSKFIPSSFGFITKYEIVGDEIHIYTPETKKGQPHKYPATKEKIAYFESRLKKQYQLIVENKAFLQKTIATEATRKILPVTTIIAIVMAIIAVCNIALTSLPIWLSAIVGAGALAIGIGGPVIVSQIVKTFSNETDIAEVYLNKRADIEALNKEDKNVTEYLSKTATKRLESNEELKGKRRLDTIFSIDFLDKSTLRDLKKLITRYLISRDLKAEQQFVIPVEETEEVSEKKTGIARKRKKEQ